MQYAKARKTQRTETSKYLQEKKINNDSPSSGERTGISPNHPCYGMCGVVGPRSRKTVIEKKRLESRAIDGDSPVF